MGRPLPPTLKNALLAVQESHRGVSNTFLALAGAILAGIGQLANPDLGATGALFARFSAVAAMTSIIAGALYVLSFHRQVRLTFGAEVMETIAGNVEAVPPSVQKWAEDGLDHETKTQIGMVRLQVLMWFCSAILFGCLLLEVLS